jgi:hypothetical protein
LSRIAFAEQLFIDAPELYQFESVAHTDSQSLHINRFLNKIKSTETHSFDSNINRAHARHHDDSLFPPLRSNFRKELKPSHARHVDIRDNEINVIAENNGKRLCARMSDLDLVIRERQNPLGDSRVLIVVIDN